ncbi:MAG: hydroxymethylbilane synthase [Planctomycetia bacterium]|nr:hydroxymethylbilane synthase [Planctomycetia bacterium]
METSVAAVGGAIRVGTRGSLLARTQTGWVVDQLRRLGHAVDIVTIATQGDARTDLPIAAIGGDGVFVRELERALLDGRIDAAVHSLKDMPTEETPGLVVACVPARAMPFDVIVSRDGGTLRSLRPGAIVGTSSVRRVAQVRLLRGDLVIAPLRGNVDTRLRRLDAGDYDCLVLAGAGLQRLGLASRITEVLEPDAFWPAVAQGALAVQVRRGDRRIIEALEPLDDPATHDAVRAERSCLATLAGGCLAPIGAWGRRGADGLLEVGGCVLEDADGHVSRIMEAVRQTASDDDPQAVSESPAALGSRLASRLIDRGVEPMLARMRGRHATR